VPAVNVDATEGTAATRKADGPKATPVTADQSARVRAEMNRPTVYASVSSWSTLSGSAEHRRDGQLVGGSGRKPYATSSVVRIVQ
jgi:hypothetical protein